MERCFRLWGFGIREDTEATPAKSTITAHLSCIASLDYGGVQFPAVPDSSTHPKKDVTN